MRLGRPGRLFASHKPVLEADSHRLLHFEDACEVSKLMLAGANNENSPGMQPSITSYDYHAPISEAGDIGQPGIGGPNKYLVQTSPPSPPPSPSSPPPACAPQLSLLYPRSAYIYYCVLISQARKKVWASAAETGHPVIRWKSNLLCL